MPINIVEPKSEPKLDNLPKFAVGIDLGTTNSLLAVCEDNKVKLITNPDDHSKLFPSVFTSGNTTLRSTKRLMGKAYKEVTSLMHQFKFAEGLAPGDDAILKLEDKVIHPIDVAAIILAQLKQRAEEEVGLEVEAAVVTVPAYFDEPARQATKVASQKAGFKVTRLLSEPTAAALAYGLEIHPRGLFLVYDLGGGTFDISLLRIEDGVCQVLATGGNSLLGGDDFDLAIARALCTDFDELDYNLRQEWLQAAKLIKEVIDKSEETTLECVIQGEMQQLTFTRARLANAVNPLIERTVTLTKQLLSQQDISTNKLDGIIMVGGATRLAMLKEKIKASFTGVEFFDSLDPDTVVAQGASYYAANLLGHSHHLLLDILPLSLGVETMGGLTSVVLPRHTALPVKKRQMFTTFVDGQTALKLHIVQGERELARDCRSLAEFILKDIPPLPAGAARIEVSFAVDVDGLLTVTAEEQTTKQCQTVVVNPSYGYSDERITEALLSSIEHGEEDMAAKLLAETRVNAEQLLLSVSKALQEDKHLLEYNEGEEIDAAYYQLQNLVISHSSARDDIISAATTLEQKVEKFMNSRLTHYLQKVSK